MSDIVKDDTQTPSQPSLIHQIEDVLRATQTLNGLRIEGLNHKVTAFTRAPLLLEEALAEIKALEQRHADALDALNRMTDQRDEALGGQPAIELPQHRLRVAIQEAAEYNEMIPLHTDDPHALHFQQMVKRWLDGKGMHPQQVDRVGQLALQLKDATRQCGVMADSLRYQREFVTANVWDDEKRSLLLDNIDAALAGELSSLPDCTEVTRTAPDRIWLHVSDDHGDHNEPFPTRAELGFSEVTWCADSQGGTQVEYLRADLTHWITKPARIGGVVFQRGIKVKTVIEAAYRAAEYEQPDGRAAFSNLLAAVQGSAPAGWKLVPVEPTREMMAAAMSAVTQPQDLLHSQSGWGMNEMAARTRYCAMLAAAPKPQGGAA